MECLKDSDVEFYTGVPDSLLKSFACMRNNSTFGSMRGSRQEPEKTVLMVTEDQAGVSDEGHPALLFV